VAFALQADGWYLRQDIIWHKPNPMPESVTDRCTKAHEYIFLMSKSAKYYYDHEAIQEESVYPNDNRKARQNKDDYDAMIGNNGQIRAVMNPSGDKAYPFRNRRSVWTVSTRPFKEAHFATFPPQLIEPCVKAGSKEGDTILDPFNGAGTTGLVACRQNRNYIGIELNPEYAEIARNRIENELNKAPLFTNA
jgi:site-specific DNA-methyltransferase (adenine-specific)